MRRRLFSIFSALSVGLTALSLLLSVLCVGVGVRSYFITDDIAGHIRQPQAIWLWGLATGRGSIGIRSQHILAHSEEADEDIAALRDTLPPLSWAQFGPPTPAVTLAPVVIPARHLWGDLSIIIFPSSYLGWRHLGFAYERQWGRSISYAVSGFQVGLPLWLPTLLFALPPLSSLRRWVRRRRRLRHGLCPTCGYDLRASKDRCPECGQPIPASVKRQTLLHES